MSNTDTAPFREMAAATRTRVGFEGTSLKFTKGRWSAGKDDVNMANRELIACVDALMFGWTKWWDKKPVDFHVGFVSERYRPPKREQLGDLDQGEWALWCSGRDPWQSGFYLPFIDPADGKTYVFSTSSRGGRDAVGALADAYADRLENAPDDPRTLPLIALASDAYMHPDFGEVATPQLDIVRWVEPPADMKRVRPPVPSSPLLAVEHKATVTIEGRATKPTEPVGSHDDMSDEIPF